MLDLSNVTDVQVASKINESLQEARTKDARRILEAVQKCSERFSFSQTRTYPRPDHPDPKKRRSLLFLFCGILVSLRTTLENEQIAMSRLMSAAQQDADLLKLSEHEIAILIQNAGMAKTKARRIYEGIRILLEFEGGIEGLSRLSKAEARDFLLKIPGVGPKSADCLLTIGLGIPSMVVDVNVYRSASWILDGKTEGLNYSDSHSVQEMKRRLDNLLVDNDAFLFQIVHTELLLLSKNMGRQGHQRERCVGSTICQACFLEEKSNGHQTMLQI